ncbi:MAG: phosphatidate cytidylyltransferase [Myxococcales bacterium]|nr:phosphatidate cytidylyltransferase [Myxococcales bacterium]
MDKKKIVVALVLLPAFIWLIGWAPNCLLLTVLMLLGAGLGGWESARLVFGPDELASRVAATAFSLAACLAAASGDDQTVAVALVGILLVSMVLAGLLSTDLSLAGGRAAKLLFVAIYPGLLAGYVAALKNYESIFFNTKLVLMLFALIWINDTGAYFVGSAIGKRKLAPRVSPNKTWEGAVGGFAASVILGAVIGVWSDHFTLGQGFLLGVVLGIVGPLGDLAESALKRGAGLKDSGLLLPGHGGVLDRIDSVLFGAPILYYAIINLHFTQIMRQLGA